MTVTELYRYEHMTEAQALQWRAFLRSHALEPGDDAQFTVILRDGEDIAAVGSRSGNILKYIAVSPEHRGEGLTAAVLTELRKNAFSAGERRLFLYTKPENRLMFEALRFYAVAETDSVLLLEDRRDGLKSFLASLPRPERSGTVGAAVMNCNPFTLGHRYLIQRACESCDTLYVFVLSEDRSMFSAADRMELVRRGTADMDNVIVCPTGDYLISSATFPDYFLRERTGASQAQCALDCEIFGIFARELGITVRFAGSEPESEITECYNRSMERLLPPLGVRFEEIPRLEGADGTVISAARVRALLRAGQPERLRSLLPETSYDYLIERGLI